MWENDIINYDLIIRDYLTSDFGELAQLVVCSIGVDLLTSTSKRYKITAKLSIAALQKLGISRSPTSTLLLF